MKTIFLLVGVPGSGKSYVADKLGDRVVYIANDDFIGLDYVGEICRKAERYDGPFLCEATFSLSNIKTPLEAEGYHVVPVFIIDDEYVLDERWEARNTPPHVRAGHLSRQKTYLKRAEELGSFVGTSAEVAHYLRGKI